MSKSTSHVRRAGDARALCGYGGASLAVWTQGRIPPTTGCANCLAHLVAVGAYTPGAQGACQEEVLAETKAGYLMYGHGWAAAATFERVGWSASIFDGPTATITRVWIASGGIPISTEEAL